MSNQKGGFTMISLPLTMPSGRHFHLGDTYLAKTADELEEFLSKQKHLNTKTFATDVMFSHELKANNLVEGYTDDLGKVEEIVKKRLQNANNAQAKRILNLYHGYHYILKESTKNPQNNLDKETLKKLYGILAKNLLDSYENNNMGEYYRTKPVYILMNGAIKDELCEGMEANLIDEFLEKYFTFFNSYTLGDSATNEYIKSQILHLYFVYIHPYFDVNGRTSRTLAMWYLLNKKAYAYIIFNRGIAFKGSRYDKRILEAIQNADMTKFILFMLDTVKEELEKEYIMESVASHISPKLTSLDYQTILYLLSMHSMLTVKDFAEMYNRFNDKKNIKEIYETAIMPLLNKGVLQVAGTTKKYMFNNYPNEILEFNPEVMDYDHTQIKRLERYR